MRMSERYQYILLCEDRQTEHFLRMLSFLQEQVNYDRVLTSLLDAKTEYDALCGKQLG